MKNNRHLVHVTASLNRGGAETVLYHLVHGLQPDFEQTVISMRDGVMADELRVLGVPVYCLNGITVASIVRLWRLLNQLKPEVIHALLWSTNAITRVYSKKTGVPLVCAVHSPFNGNTGNIWWRSMVDRATGRWSTKTVFVTETVRRQAVLAGQVLPEQALVIENGIDRDLLDCTARKTSISRAVLGLDDQHVIMGTVGRLVQVKNHRLLLQVMAQLTGELPQLRLVIVGDGPLKNELGEEINALGLADTVQLVTGLGAAYYPPFDFFVLPSFTEGLSMALLEAMSTGLPAVVSSTATGGVVVHGENGMTCDSGALDEWMACVRDLVVNKNVRIALGSRAMQIVKERFDSQTMVSAYNQLFSNLIG